MVIEVRLEIISTVAAVSGNNKMWDHKKYNRMVQS